MRGGIYLAIVLLDLVDIVDLDRNGNFSLGFKSSGKIVRRVEPCEVEMHCLSLLYCNCIPWDTFYWRRSV